MATYIVVLDFTDQGIKNLRESTERADSFIAEAEAIGAKIGER